MSNNELNTNKLNTTDPALDRARIHRAHTQQGLPSGTGPRTPEPVSRLSALPQTLCSQTVVSTRTNLRAYQRFLKRFFSDFKPKGIVEMQLVHRLADCGWALNCARAHAANLLAVGLQEPEARVEVEDLEVQFALESAKSYRAQTRTLASISLHEQRVSREFLRNLKEIREIQAVRREHEGHQTAETAGKPAR